MTQKKKRRKKILRHQKTEVRLVWVKRHTHCKGGRDSTWARLSRRQPNSKINFATATTLSQKGRSRTKKKRKGHTKNKQKKNSAVPGWILQQSDQFCLIGQLFGPRLSRNPVTALCYKKLKEYHALCQTNNTDCALDVIPHRHLIVQLGWVKWLLIQGYPVDILVPSVITGLLVIKTTQSVIYCIGYENIRPDFKSPVNRL